MTIDKLATQQQFRLAGFAALKRSRRRLAARQCLAHQYRHNHPSMDPAGNEGVAFWCSETGITCAGMRGGGTAHVQARLIVFLP